MSKPSHPIQASANHYQAYLVRFWRTDESAGWRAYARNVQTDEIHHFRTIEQCVAFLQQASLGEQ